MSLNEYLIRPNPLLLGEDVVGHVLNELNKTQSRINLSIGWNQLNKTHSSIEFVLGSKGCLMSTYVTGGVPYYPEISSYNSFIFYWWSLSCLSQGVFGYIWGHTQFIWRNFQASKIDMTLLEYHIWYILLSRVSVKKIGVMWILWLTRTRRDRHLSHWIFWCMRKQEKNMHVDLTQTSLLVGLWTYDFTMECQKWRAITF